MANPLLEVQQYGQSIWLDYIRRSLITSGGLQAFIQNDGLRGVTSNPSIFEKAIGGSTDYNDPLKALVQQADMDAKALFEALAIEDIQQATDLFLPVYEQTRKRDGYVSMEVSPYLAHDTQGTIEEARRLWKALSRPNVMIKVPATPEGIPAIRQLISEGINVNVTLLFSMKVYETVADAFMAGLEALVARGGDPSGVASVASFFISRIDTAVDTQLAERLQQSRDPVGAGGPQRGPGPVPGLVGALKSLQGKVAIANAKLTYQRYGELVASPRWQALAQKGAQTQRLLWASTSTKNPAYRDVMYVEELIGRDTVDTIPAATLDAFRDHGHAQGAPGASLEEGVPEAQRTMEALAETGISMDDVTARLVEDGVRLFADAFDMLLGAVEQKREAILGPAMDRQATALPPELDQAVKASLEEWRASGKVRRLWAMDPTVWTGDGENQWLGWLGVACDQMAHAEPFQRLAREVKQAGFTHAMVLGMGGSSLFPEVLAMTFGKIGGFPELLVLDSTDPARIRSLERRIDLARTLFIVSSKSGTTLEPNIFQQYFFERVKQTVGEQEAGSRFIAITDPAPPLTAAPLVPSQRGGDPGSKLQQVAEAQHFRRTYFGVPSIGGRYSALSNFGMVPAAVMGLDVAVFLDRAEEMVHSCAGVVPPEENPGVVLGTVLGVLANRGRDKVTLITSAGIADFGAWLEQLLAESTGKQGKGLIPVDREPLGPPEVYGQDRLFVYTRLEKAPDPTQDRAVEALQAAGQPVVRIAIADPLELGEEVFRWEIATAVAGSVLGINPFDQPDVEASKVATRKLTSEYEQTGSLPPESPFSEGNGIRLFTDAANAAALQAAAGNDRSLAGILKAHLGRLRAGDYFALLAYVEMSDVHEAALQAMRQRVRDARRVATCLGFGPRYLHSTGQAYKGGPNTGVFLQITSDEAADLPVPGQKYTFSIVKAAQARGDFAVLTERGRRALRAHLGADVPAGLAALRAAVEQAVRSD